MRNHVQRAWEGHYAAVSSQNPLQGTRALLAYNSVIDRVRRLDEAWLARLPTPRGVPPLFAKEVEDLEDLTEALVHSISKGLALEVLCADAVIGFLDETGGFEGRPGGQVATVARLLSNFGAERILVHPDRFNWELASLYQGTSAQVPLRLRSGLAYPPADEFYWECEPEVHHILEYPEGLAFGDGPAPRANRLIAAPQTRIQFHPEWERALPDAGRATDLFFLAGLNHMGQDFEESFRRVREHIRSARSKKPKLAVHLEMTSTPDLRKREAILDRIVPLLDSLSVNETELADLAFLLGLPRWEAVREDPVQQLEALHLLRALGVPRVNMHTPGYYLTLSSHPVERVRRAHLFAALVAAVRARIGRTPEAREVPRGLDVPLAEHGAAAAETLGTSLGLRRQTRSELVENGWIREEELVLVPTRMVGRPRYTVGLGDTISGAAVFGEGWP
ncbi:MAG: ADP-dependent glucokinase/phosphofructokinase [Thermoplasmata archaeon]|nr:ADP-dependent glucokinase/phosphofructokinase [Thermoplasmata archaeon]